MWEVIGKLQFDFMVEKGLKPNNYLLDIGCGALRGGIHFIKYLEKGHYYGFDESKRLIDEAKVEIKHNNLNNKNPQLLLEADFDISKFNVMFDFMLAQAVFTHLVPESIKLCLSRVMDKLKLSGVFYATFFDPVNCRLEAKVKVYSYEFLKSIADELGIECKYVGERKPRKRNMVAFRKS